jgi:UPF0042 nucleotide-binding protein
MSSDSLKRPVILITGMSGSGKSIALKTFEDMGYETIDNLPLSFLEGVARTSQGEPPPLAIAVDVRTRGFTAERFLEELQKLSQDKTRHTQFIFFDCEDEILVRRYNASRRLHPLAHERPVLDGMRVERHIMSSLQDHADMVIDTSHLSTADLKGQLRRRFLPKKSPGLSILVMSFSYRHGLPREADIVFDARALKNPFYEENLSLLSGETLEVADYIEKDPLFPLLLNSLKEILSLSLPRFEKEGRQYLTLAIGCTGGQHRSVFVAKTLAEWLQTEKKHVKLKHRDVKERKKQ